MKTSAMIRLLALSIAAWLTVVTPVVNAAAPAGAGVPTGPGGSSAGQDNADNPMAPGGGAGGTVGSLPCYNGTFGPLVDGVLPNSGMTAPNMRIIVPPAVNGQYYVWVIGGKPVAGNALQIDAADGEREIRYNSIEIKQLLKMTGSVSLVLVDGSGVVVAVYNFK